MTFDKKGKYRSFTLYNTARVTLDVNRLETSQPEPRRLSTLFVHRLIGTTFLKEPTHYKKGTLIEVHHIGAIGNKSHNDPRYIKWLSNIENTNENFQQTIFPDVN